VIHESIRAAELAPEYGLLRIPGVEVSTEVDHLLAIGVTEMPPGRAPLDETVTWVRSSEVAAGAGALRGARPLTELPPR